MNAQPIDPNTQIDDLHPARFLKPADLIDRWKVQSITVTIAAFQWESTVPNPRDIDPATRKPREVTQPVLYFRTKSGDTFPRGYLLSSKYDVLTLKSATNAATIGETIGKRITINLAQFKDKTVLRIDPTPPAPAPKP